MMLLFHRFQFHVGEAGNARRHYGERLHVSVPEAYIGSGPADLSRQRLMVIMVDWKQYGLAVVVVIAVLVMDGQLAQSFACEFARASCADVRKDLERLRPVVHQLPEIVRLAQSRTMARRGGSSSSASS